MLQLHVPAVVIHTGYSTRPFLLHYVPTIAATSRALVVSMRPSCTFLSKIHSWQSSDCRCHCPFPCQFRPLLLRCRNNWPGPMYPHILRNSSSDDIKSNFNLASSSSCFYQSSKFDEIHWQIARVLFVCFNFEFLSFWWAGCHSYSHQNGEADGSMLTPAISMNGRLHVILTRTERSN